MDDQMDWAAIEAETFGTEASEPVSPANDEQALSLQDDNSISDTQSETAPETQEAAVETQDVSADTETVSDETAKRIAELEHQLAAQQQAEAQRVAAAEAKVRAYQEQQRLMAEQADAQEAQAFVEQLVNQGDDELAQAYQERRNYLVQTREEALIEAKGSLSALEAATLLMDQYLSPEQMESFVKEAYQLVQMPTLTQKQQWLASRSQAQTAATERELALQREVQELRNQLVASSRPIAADVVEGGRSGGGETLNQRLDKAADFNDWFATLNGAAA
jgi:hypothetical protein